MINLLPPEKKEELFFEHQKKMILVLGGAAVVSLFCFSLVLLSVKFYILSEIASKSSEIQNLPANFTASKQIIQKYNLLMPKIVSFYEGEKISKALFDFLSIPMPKSFDLSSISLKKSGPLEPMKAVITGSFENREELLAFKNAIEEASFIKNSQFSTESWIKEKDPAFSVSFEFSYEK